MFSVFSMFSIFSMVFMLPMFPKLTSCSAIWDGKMEQFLQPWITQPFPEEIFFSLKMKIFSFDPEEKFPFTWVECRRREMRNGTLLTVHVGLADRRPAWARLLIQHPIDGKFNHQAHRVRELNWLQHWPLGAKKGTRSRVPVIFLTVYPRAVEADF